MEKPENVLRSETTNRPTAFKITFEAIVHVFVARHAERKGNLVFNIMYGKFCFDGDFFVRNLDASVELRHCQSLSRRIFFFSCQNGTLFLFFGPVFFSFHQGLSSAFDFSMSKDSVSKELPRVNFVKCAM